MGKKVAYIKSSFNEESLEPYFIQDMVQPGNKIIAELTPPIIQDDNTFIDWVYISKVTVFGLEETFIFECDKNGENIKFRELPDSVRENIEPIELLKRMGYEIKYGKKEEDECV